MQLVARAMVRGQGEDLRATHERIIPIGHKMTSAMQHRRGSQEMKSLAGIAKSRIEDVGKIQRILSHAIQVFAAGGDGDKVRSEHRSRARSWS